MYSFGYFKKDFGPMTGGGGHLPPSTPPKVMESAIFPDSEDGILILWNVPMKVTKDPQAAFNIIINGGAPIHPKEVVFNPQDRKMMGLLFDTAFVQGDVVTWAYDDQHPTITLESVHGAEADNQTYAVENKLNGHGTPTADNDILSVDDEQNTADEG